MAMPARFPIRFTGANRAMALLGIAPDRCRVEVDEGELRVRMAWAFRLDVPRAKVRAAARDERRVWGSGVHGWRGKWLVNGSSSGLARIELDPPGHARVIGFPVRIRVLVVSVEDPPALLEALRVPTG